ncbi:MFS transporter [Streptomyces sp. NPDC004539]|uniref:MFS transporter n=1 Tax=Streptomyces sp. NPDC004539 TaxID=3154280 RepID=UPI0033BA1A8A
MTADIATPVRAGRRPAVVLLIVSAATFLVSLDLFIVNIAFPAIRETYPGTGLATLSWTLNAYTVAFAALLAPAGRLADRYGRRLVFLAGVAVFTIGSTACALAPSIEALIAFRALQAVGGALVTPTALALLLAAFPPERRARAVSVWAGVGGAAAALGPPLGGLLVELSWRLVFLVNVPLGLLALAFGRRVLTESRDASSGVPDLLGAVGLVTGVGAAVWALVSAHDHGWGGAPVLTGFGVGAAGLFWVVRRSARHPVPLLDLAALRVPTFWLSCLAMLVFSTAFGSMLFGNVLFLTGLWHDSALAAGFALTPGPLMVVLLSLTVCGPLVARLGPGPVAALGSLLFLAGSLVWLLRLGATPDYAGALLPGQLLTGAGVALVMSSLTGVVGLVLPPARWGAGSSMLNTSRQLGSALGTAILVAVLGPAPDLGAFRHGWLFLAGAALVSAAFAVAVAARRGSADVLGATP